MSRHYHAVKIATEGNNAKGNNAKMKIVGGENGRLDIIRHYASAEALMSLPGI
jgi:hypothetical protein